MSVFSIRALFVFGLCLTALAIPSFADIQFTVTNGVAASDGSPLNALANFHLDTVGQNLVITLTNTAGAGQLSKIASVFDGLAFTLDTAPGFTLTSVAPTAGSNPALLGTAGFTPYIDCSDTGTCHYVSLFDFDQANNNAVDANFNWTIAHPGAYQLFAGSGSFKPAGVVDDNIVGSGGNGGVSNASHNDYLDGPVVFTLHYSGNAPTDVTSATFYFGTAGDTADGTPSGGLVVTSVTPEPSTLILLGSALVAAGLIGRKRSSKS